MGKFITHHPWTVVTCVVATCLAVATILLISPTDKYDHDVDELLLKVHLQAQEPYAPPPNMYLWWGPETNHRFVGSGERIRHIFNLGRDLLA